jgi:hypothetical protein
MVLLVLLRGHWSAMEAGSFAWGMDMLCGGGMGFIGSLIVLSLTLELGMDCGKKDQVDVRGQRGMNSAFSDVLG